MPSTQPLARPPTSPTTPLELWIPGGSCASIPVEFELLPACDQPDTSESNTLVLESGPGSSEALWVGEADPLDALQVRLAPNSLHRITLAPTFRALGELELEVEALGVLHRGPVVEIDNPTEHEVLADVVVQAGANAVCVHYTLTSEFL